MRALLAAIVLVASAPAAFAQNEMSAMQAQREFQTFYGGMRAASACPALMEDWQYNVLMELAAQRENRLTGGAPMDGETLAGLAELADSRDCDDAELQEFLALNNRSAAFYWLLVHGAMAQTPSCQAHLPNWSQAAPFYDAFSGELKTWLEGQEHPEVVDNAARQADIMAADFGPLCADPESGIMVSLFSYSVVLEAPWRQYQNLSDAATNDRRRKFHSHVWQDGVLGVRANAFREAAVIGQQAAGCSGKVSAAAEEVECALSLNRDGSATVTLGGDLDSFDSLDDGEIWIFPREGGQALAGIPAAEAPAGKSGPLHFPGVLDALREAGLQDRVRVAFAVTLNGEAMQTMAYLGGQYPDPGVAVGDLLKAYDYAYSEEDLSKTGLVAAAAAALED